MKTRRHNALLPILWLLTICCTSTSFAQENGAQANGQDKLDQAMLAKLSARSFGQLEQVVRDTQAAIEAGLEGDDLKFANFLIAATLTGRATILSRNAFDRPLLHSPVPNPPVPNPQLKKIRQQAFLDLRRAIKADGSIAQSHFLLGRYLALPGGDRKRAIEAFDAAIRLDKGNKSVRARALVYRANLQTDAKQRLADYNQAIELAPRDVEAIRSRGVFYLSQRKLDVAQADFTTALALDENDDDSHLVYGLALMFGGKFAEAKKSFDRVIELTPEAPMAYVHRARCNAVTGDNEAALADVRKALTLSPTNLTALMLRAMLYTALKRSEKAVETYSQAIRLAPERWAAYRGRGDAHLSLGRQAKAIADYEAALKIDPKQTGVLNNLAWVLSTSPDEKLRDGPRAIKLATKACELTAYKQAHIISTLAAGCAETGDFDNAVKWSKRAIEVGDTILKGPLRKELASYLKKKPWRELKKHP